LGFSVLDLTTDEISVPIKEFWGWTYKIPEGSITHELTEFWVMSMTFVVIYLCVRYLLKASSYRTKQQAKFFLIGFSTPFIVGLIGEIVCPALGIKIPELTTTAVMAGNLFVGYGIWRYDLFTPTPESVARDIISTMTDALLLVNPNGRINSINKAALRLLKYEESELIGKNLNNVLMDRHEQPTPDGGILEQLERKGFISDYEMSFIAKDGRNIPISLSAFILREKDGAFLGYVIVVRAITLRKKAEEEKKIVESKLLQAQKMEAIGTLAGGVAHDLNNVLAGLISYPELLLMEMPEDSPLKKPILKIQKSGEKAAAIVQDLLTLARRGVAATEVVNLNHIISEYLKSPEYEKLQSFHPKIHVESNCEEDPLHILGSSVHLFKTVMNLVSNAAEAMPDGGKILISTENRYIDSPIRGCDDVEEGDYVTLTVSDTGIGISPEDIERIFEPFYTKKMMGRSGTGLGMAVVWGTVKDHKGYIDVKSAQGKGTTFTLYFPATRKEAAKDKSFVSIEDYMGNGESLLVVDDVEEQREIASRIRNLQTHKM